MVQSRAVNLSLAEQKLLMDVARQAICAALGGQEAQEPPFCAHDGLLRPAGCFVSLHEYATGQLRGCIGCMEALRPLWHAVKEMAEQVLQDPRFAGNRITLAELQRLEMEISVLSQLLPASHPLDFQPLEHGIQLACGRRSGCFLPQVARQTGWRREELLDRLCTEKMGLPAGAWRDGQAQLHTFTVIVIGPERLVLGPAASLNGAGGDNLTS